MKLKLIRFFIVGIFALSSVTLSAQSSLLDEYKAEIGVNAGGSYYLGDANGLLFNNMQLSYGGFFRYVLNPRIAFRAEFNYAGIKGDYLNSTNSLKFNNTIYSVDFCGEFNFFDLERNPYKRLSKTFSPYIFAGVGMIYSDSIKASIPFGMGMKVKLSSRWNLNVQWSNRLSFGDNLEGKREFNNPSGLNGSNIFNNDLLSTLTIGISYDIWKKDCKCENAYSVRDNHRYKKRQTKNVIF
jgi:hypothetical protein